MLYYGYIIKKNFSYFPIMKSLIQLHMAVINKTDRLRMVFFIFPLRNLRSPNVNKFTLDSSLLWYNIRRESAEIT